MATTDLRLDEPGTLPKPGPVGRVVRLLFGVLCLWYVRSLFDIAGNLFDSNDQIRSIVWNGVIPGLILVSYVVNIGYSRAWKKWPAMISVTAFLAIAGLGQLSSGTVETSLLANSIWLWAI